MSESPAKGPPPASAVNDASATNSDSDTRKEVSELAAQAVAAEDGTAEPETGQGSEESPVVTTIGAPAAESVIQRIPDKVKTLLVGKPRDLADESVFHHVSLVAFLAWV